MRGKTGDSHASGSSFILVRFLAGECSLYWLALIAVLMSCGLGCESPEGNATAGQPSAAENEAGPSDRATSPETGVVSEPSSSRQTEEGAEDSQIDPLEPILLLHRASDPEIDPKEREALIERALRIGKEQQLAREAARQEAEEEAARRIASMREGNWTRKDWPAPLGEMVYERILFDSPELITDWRGPPPLTELVNEYVLYEYVLYDYRMPSGPILAAIELRHNETSFKLLLKYALKNPAEGYGYSESLGDDFWTNPIVQAFRFLRAYDPTEEARAKVENALQFSIQQSQEEGPVASQAAARAKCLRSLLASWDFAQGLSDTRRKAYQDYERCRWMAWVLTRPSYSRGRGPDRFSLASGICPWPEGDEEFFLRNFESPASTLEDVRLSGYIAFLQPDGTYRFSDDGIRRLEAVAEGDSPWAKYAAEILPRLKNQEEQ